MLQGKVSQCKLKISEIGTKVAYSELSKYWDTQVLANSVDLDQTAPEGTDLLRSTVCRSI